MNLPSTVIGQIYSVLLDNLQTRLGCKKGWTRIANARSGLPHRASNTSPGSPTARGACLFVSPGMLMGTDATRSQRM